MNVSRPKKLWGLAAGLALLTGACATIGTSFRFRPSDIAVGRTTQSELIAEFGRPTRVGYDDGSEKWAYAYYHLNLFGGSDVRNLDVVFDAKGVVSSYTYESSNPQEIARQVPASAPADKDALPAAQ